MTIRLARLLSFAVVSTALVGCGAAGSAAPQPTPNPDAPVQFNRVDPTEGFVKTTASPAPTAPKQFGAPSLAKAAFPRFTRKAVSGNPGDPVNLLIAGTEEHLMHIFGSAGWVGADPITIKSAIKMGYAAISQNDYPTAPVSDLFLYARKQDLAFEKNSKKVYERDHLRCWKTPIVDRLNRPFWAVAASRDVAIKLVPGKLETTHQISPDLDAERQLVVDDFLKSGHVTARYQLQALSPDFHGMNGDMDEYFTDGQVEVLELANVQFAKNAKK